ncbi:MAG: hypothetical protein CL816_01480 [Coxiellaceae bacterium]|nr:hypothetical protein [Coxiellaceae bacterium]|tara:strand:- start:961 stop:2217 length:1257 start_codon:yes stop_codon:yes gene_type:complete
MIHGQQIGTVTGKPNTSQLFQQSYNSQTNKPSVVPRRKKTEVRGVNLYADFSGCGHWRMIWPEILLNGYHHAVVHGTTTMCYDENFWASINVVRLQRQASPTQKEYSEFLNSKKHLRTMYEIDDVLFIDDIPDYNKYRKAFDNNNVQQSARDIIQMCDEVTVTCDFMKKYYMSKTTNKNVTVIPNFMPRFWLDGFFNEKDKQVQYDHSVKKRKKPRVLWSGSGAHFNQSKDLKQDDFTHINKIIESTLNKYQWVLFGSVPQPLQEHVKSGKIEFHKWVPIYDYPRKLASLKATVCIAPLVDNIFNNSKSDLKFIESCAMGTPVICQDMETYRHTPYKFSTGAELVDQIDAIVSNKLTYMKISRKFREAANNRWLEDNINVYKELYTHPYKHKDRVEINKINKDNFYDMSTSDIVFPKV